MCIRDSGKKIVKIGAVDTEIASLIVKKEEINASKIDSPSASLPSGLKYRIQTLSSLTEQVVLPPSNSPVGTQKRFFYALVTRLSRVSFRDLEKKSCARKDFFTETCIESL